MQTLSIALDWTPNTNHIGIFVAQQLGFYKELGLEVAVVHPLADNYQVSPGKKLELDEVDFSIAPFETVISLNNKPNKVHAVAIFALLQEDLSCIVSLESAEIKRMKDLDGKIYASYKARYEDLIVKEMIKADGGVGEPVLQYPDRLGIWNTLLEGKADATWIFDNWEGVEAATRGVELRKFYLSQHGIPYGYSPVIFTKKESMEANRELYSQFLEATRRGYLHASTNQAEACQILYPHLTPYDQQQVDLKKSLEVSAPFFGDDTTCGKMKSTRVQAFLDWLVAHGLEDARILEQDLYTNELG